MPSPAASGVSLSSALSERSDSLNSAREAAYEAYYQPRGYRFADVCESLRAAVGAGAHASLNLLCFPGLTDTEPELEALAALVEDTGLQMIQLRNLNIDPDLYRGSLPPGLVGRGRSMRWLSRATRSSPSMLTKSPRMGVNTGPGATQFRRTPNSRSQVWDCTKLQTMSASLKYW